MRFLILTAIIVFGATFTASAQVFDYVVAKDVGGTHSTVQSAIDACPDGVRKTIFVKNGTYREKVMIGSHSKTSNKVISLIGESASGVLIVWDDYNGKTIVYDGSTVVSGTPQSATFTVNAKDFYAENISVQNEYLDKQAVALYNVADRQTFKNCRLVGFQDTHYLKKGRRSYFLDCYIEGGTDYICAGGTAIFEGCQLKSLKNGSYISAPEDITAYTQVGGNLYFHGFVFRNCVLNSNTGIEVYLGRPWQTQASSVYIDCKMEHIKPEGWSTWGSTTNHLSSFFAEYNSMDLTGHTVDISGRVSWSYQLTKDEVDTYYTNTSIYSHVADSYDPVNLTTPLGVPANLGLTNGSVSWDAVPDAIGYAVFRDGQIHGFTATNSYHDENASLGVDYLYTVKSIKNTGCTSGLSVQLTVRYTSTWVDPNEQSLLRISVLGKTVGLSLSSYVRVYSLTGRLLVEKDDASQLDLWYLPSCIYIVKAVAKSGASNQARIVLR